MEELTESCRLEQRLDEPGEFARGGFSPFIKGLPLNKYREIAPVKIGLIETSELTYTDLPGNYRLVDRLQEIWQESISNAIDQREWNMPPVSPPVINGKGYLLDGNHRSVAASWHSPKMNAILIENQRDLNALHRLVQKEVLFWPHGELSYRELEDKLEDCGQSLGCWEYSSELEDLRARDSEMEDEEEFRLNDAQKKDLLRYLTSKTIHQVRPSFLGKGAFIYEPSSGTYMVGPYLRALNCGGGIMNFKIEEVYTNVRELAKKNPLVRENSVFSLDDVAQEVVSMLRPHLEE